MGHSSWIRKQKQNPLMNVRTTDLLFCLRRILSFALVLLWILLNKVGGWKLWRRLKVTGSFFQPSGYVRIFWLFYCVCWKPALLEALWQSSFICLVFSTILNYSNIYILNYVDCFINQWHASSPSDQHCFLDYSFQMNKWCFMVEFWTKMRQNMFFISFSIIITLTFLEI